MGKVKDTDRGYTKLTREVFGMKAPKIRVGIFNRDGKEQYPNPDGGDPVTVLEVAIWNEFGTERIPERSFIRAWFDENQAKCRQAVRNMCRGILAGKYTKKQALELLAQRFVGEIQKRMAQGIPPPNHPYTIKMKGSSKPLIDTGQLRSSITYEVEGFLFPTKGESKASKARKKLRDKVKKKQRAARVKQIKAFVRTTKKSAKSVFKDTRRTVARGSKKAQRTVRSVSKQITRGAKRAGNSFLKRARRALRGKRRR